ncbi:hypothetical protein ILYODFUR_030888 [Ilyodon furcidens]|uniref:Uncharacterized protein n=1 Tax=Ilyodon furcidens TaxID=33524 RepID=A0ABV0TCF3_9TELE
MTMLSASPACIISSIISPSHLPPSTPPKASSSSHSTPPRTYWSCIKYFIFSIEVISRGLFFLSTDHLFSMRCPVLPSVIIFFSGNCYTNLLALFIVPCFSFISFSKPIFWPLLILGWGFSFL